MSKVSDSNADGSKMNALCEVLKKAHQISAEQKLSVAEISQIVSRARVSPRRFMPSDLELLLFRGLRFSWSLAIAACVLVVMLPEQYEFLELAELEAEEFGFFEVDRDVMFTFEELL